MPATKNNNNPADPVKPSKKERGEGAHPDTQWERYRAPRVLRELTQAKDKPAPPARYEELDKELVLEFLAHYHDLGRALVQAGFTRPGQAPGILLPNWEQFALHIEERFDPDSEEMVQGAVSYLNWHDENLALRNARLDNSHPWETYDVDNDMVWLAESIQRVAHQLSDEISHMDRQPLDVAQVCAVLDVVMAWAEIDPEVARWLENPDSLL